jgi:pimeloyl-ACP methyl ester carboxylesterase
MSLAETPEFLESAGRRLFAVRRTPSGAARGAVVLCHAFGEEKKSSHRNLVEAARLMAERGFASLTPDLTGCGDSDGSLADATIEAWMGDLAVAQEHLARHVTAGVPLFLLGLRLDSPSGTLLSMAGPPSRPTCVAPLSSRCSPTARTGSPAMNCSTISRTERAGLTSTASR